MSHALAVCLSTGVIAPVFRRGVQVKGCPVFPWCSRGALQKPTKRVYECGVKRVVGWVNAHQTAVGVYRKCERVSRVQGMGPHKAWCMRRALGVQAVIKPIGLRGVVVGYPIPNLWVWRTVSRASVDLKSFVRLFVKRVFEDAWCGQGEGVRVSSPGHHQLRCEDSPKGV